jgi:spore coat protein U-like protein
MTSSRFALAFPRTSAPTSAPALAAAIALGLCLVPLRAEAMVCSFTTVVGVSFGNYNVFGSAAVDAAGSMTYLCTTGPASFVTIDISTGSSGVTSARTLTRGASALTYNLYESAARTGNPWGNGTGSTTHYGPVLVVLDAATTVDVYGRIPGSQNVAAGAYSDTVVLTINF